MAAPAPRAPRDTYVLRSSSFCREEFRGFQFQACARVFVEAPSKEDVARGLLCVALGTNPEELSECDQLSAGLTFRDMTAAGSLIRRRFGDGNVNGAGIVLGRAAPVIELFALPVVPPARPAAPPVPAPPRVPRAPPPAPPVPAVPVAAPPSPFAAAVLRCLRGAELTPTLLDAVIGAALEIDGRLRPDDQLDELCHQVTDAHLFSTRQAVVQEPGLGKFLECLCPKAPSSLLQLLARA